MVYSVGYMRPEDDVSEQEEYATVQDALKRFEALRRQVGDGREFEWCGITIGAWGFLIEYDEAHGVQLFRDLDPDAVLEALDVLNEKG